MRALSLRQPWAEMVMLGWKTIETRKWRTKYRGELLIVASKSRPDDVPDYTRIQDPPMIFGKAVAICDLTDCRPMEPTDEEEAWFKNEPGRFAWLLDKILRIEPFPVKGQLGLYNVELPR